MAQLIQQTLEQERWQREMIEQRYTQYTEDDEEVREAAPTQEGMDLVPPTRYGAGASVSPGGIGWGCQAGGHHVPTPLRALCRRASMPRMRRRR